MPGSEPEATEPPTDLRERELPLLESRGPWTRLHRAAREPLFFGKTGSGRFDDPEGWYGVLYLAEDAFGAFIETFGRSPGENKVFRSQLESRAISEVSARRSVRLVDVTGAGLARLGATVELSAGSHEVAQKWSRAIHEHPARPDGILYRLKHDPERLGAALFERAGSETLEARTLGFLSDPEQRPLLRDILVRYEFALID